MGFNLQDMMADETVYRRTAHGQAALSSPSVRLTTLERTFLAAVTGFTPLRVLLDLGFDDMGIANVIARLASQGLIVAVTPVSSAARR